MKVKMLEDREAALDGVNFSRLEAGETYEVPDFLAESYLERGIAKAAAADAAIASAEPVPDPDAPPAADAASGSLTGEDDTPAEAEQLADAEEKPRRRTRSSRAKKD